MSAKSNMTREVAAYGKVAVLYGGLSREREVSLKSGKAVLEALQKGGVDAHGVDVGADILEVLANGHFDRVFIILHGRGGEDGVLQGTLEMMGLPYTGSGVLGSALSMDKVRSKQIWSACGLPTLPFEQLRADTDFDAVVRKLGLPMVVKPVREGSSIGVAKVERAGDLEAAWREAAKCDDDVIAEPWMSGGEYTATILDGRVLPLIRVAAPQATFYDYEAKYLSDQTQYFCPSGLPPEKEAAFAELALEAFRVLGASGWGRVDLLCDEQGNPWLMENNTLPGMTDHSLVPMAARAVGIEFEELVLRILDTSMPTSGEGR